MLPCINLMSKLKEYIMTTISTTTTKMYTTSQKLIKMFQCFSKKYLMLIMATFIWFIYFKQTPYFKLYYYLNVVYHDFHKNIKQHK